MKYKISMAPMEGLTGYVYRRAHHAYFAPLDTYYTPFISNKKLGSRERHYVLPEHNEGMHPGKGQRGLGKAAADR